MTEKNRYWTDQEHDAKYPWTLVKISNTKLVITWQEKYGGERKVECVGIWENESQYMLTHRDGRKVIIEKSNINSLQIGESNAVRGSFRPRQVTADCGCDKDYI